VRSVASEVVAVSDSDETERFEARVSSALVEAAGPWAYGEKKQLIEDALKQRAYGNGIVETEAVITENRGKLEAAIAAFRRLEQEFSNVPQFGFAERIREERIALTYEFARANHERRKEVESAERASPEERVDKSDLEWLEQQTICNGDRVWSDHAKVQEVASDGVTGEEVVALLRERNPDVPDERFEERNLYETGQAGGRR